MLFSKSTPWTHLFKASKENWCLYYQIWIDFAYYSGLSIVVFQLVNAGRVSNFASFEAVEYGGFVKRLFIHILLYQEFY